MPYYINIGDFVIGEEDDENKIVYPNRCLSAATIGCGVETDTIPWEGTEYNPWDFKYEDGEFVLDVIPAPEPDPEPTTEEILLELAADHEARLCEIELGVN